MFSIVMALFLIQGTPDPDGIWAAMESINPDAIRQNVAFLSSDELGGRGTGTDGEKKAAQFIADHFAKNGLKPLTGNQFFQPVSLVGYRKNSEKSSLAIHGEKGPFEYENDGNLTYWSSSQKPLVKLSKAPLVFVGYGVEAPEYQWDDFKGYDCKGKVLVFLNNDPPVEENGQELFEGKRRTYYGRWTYKFEQAMRHGAAGAMMIHTTPSAGYGWQVVGHNGAEEGFALDLPGSGYQVDFLAWIDEKRADALAQGIGQSLESWFNMAAKRDFKPVELPFSVDATIQTEIRKTQSQNVVGLLEGSDPSLKKEMIVFTAHYDHLGTAESGEGDRIYNGAWDNGLGTGCIMELARAIGQSSWRPKRSFVFVACAAEEKGSLGSRWFVAKPMVPAKQFVANINIDMPQIFGTTRDLTAIGRNASNLGESLDTAAVLFARKYQQEPVVIKDDQNPNAGSFYRSDQVNFAKAGIPAVFLNPGRDFSEGPTTDPSAYRDAHYHQPSDEINEAWDLKGCARDLRLTLLAAGLIGDAEQSPRWNKGNEFEAAWEHLQKQ